MPDVSFPRPIPFAQNGRRCWVTTITTEKAAELTLPTQGQQMTMFEIANRGIDESHVGAIAKYLASPHWALPALILAVLPGVMPDGSRGSLVCDAAGLRVLDGQHRIKGLSDSLLAGNREVAGQELAVVIIEVTDAQDQGQIWQDFAKNKQISGAWRDAVDQRSPFVRAAKLAAEECAALRGRVRVDRRNVGLNDPELLTLGGLKLLATTIAIGIQRAATAKHQQLYAAEERQRELCGRVSGFFGRFLPMCGGEFDLLAEGERFGDTIRGRRLVSCAFDTPALNLIANVHARWLEAGKPEERLAGLVARLSLSKTAPENWLSRQSVYDAEKMVYAPARERRLWADASIAMAREADGGQ